MKKIYRIIEEKRTSGESKFYIERFSKFLFIKSWIRKTDRTHEQDLEFRDFKSAKEHLDYLLIGKVQIIELYRTS